MARRRYRRRRRASYLGMAPGECRTTRKGQTFCKDPRTGKVRFKSRRAASRLRDIADIGEFDLGRTCVATKRVRSRSGRYVRRCARYA